MQNPQIDTEKLEKYRAVALGQNHGHLLVSVISSIIFMIWLGISYKIAFSSDSLIAPMIITDICLVTLLTSLCGKLAGAGAIWVAFNVITFFFRDGFAYEYIILIALSLISNLPARRKWYESFFKTILAFCVICFVMMFVALIFINIALNGAEISAEFFFGILFVCTVSTGISCAFLFLYHHFAPKRVKDFFPESVFASREIRAIEKYFVGHFRRDSSVARKQTAFIVGEAVTIIIMATGIAGSLMGTLPAKPSAQDHALFMMKFVQILILEAVPGILFAVDYTRSKIANPIMLMSHAIDEFFENLQNKEGEKIFDIYKLGIKNKDEIGVLYESLRKTVTNVTAYVDTLEREKALEKDLVASQAASKAKSDFLSSMSHEIRTPINAVLGLDEMILREADDTQIRSYANDIQSSGKMLLSIINDILDFSKIEAGKMEIIPVDYDLSAVIADLVNMTASRAESKGLSFLVEIDEKMPHLLHGDDTRLKQCMLNILTNAVKYTRSGSVTLKVSSEQAAESKIRLTVHVIDTGIGIKPEDLQKLYSPFERIEEKRNRGIEGTGLGMSIVRNLLVAMGSKIEVASEYGKGSDFFFTVEQEVCNWEEIGDWKKTHASHAAASTYQESFQSPAAKILVVDDTEMNLTVIKALLKSTRIQIATANDGLMGLEKARSEKYDIIFIDHLMPKMDGLEMLASLRAESESPNRETPCVALTANAMGDAREMYLEAGFADYLSKPIDSAKLESMISQMLPKEKVLHKGDEGFLVRSEKGEGSSSRGEVSPSATMRRSEAAKPFSPTPSAGRSNSERFAPRNAPSSHSERSEESLSVKSDARLSYEEKKKLEAEKRKAEKLVAQIEEEIAKTEEEKQAEENKMASPEVYSNGEKAKAVQAKITELSQKLDELNSKWEEAAMKLEEIGS